MKIAQIAPIFERVPPLKHGGIERVVYALTEELVRRGHQVTLFASGNSITSAKLVSTSDKPFDNLNTKDWLDTNPDIMRHLGNAYDLQSQFDIIHDHNDYLSLPTANLSTTPVVMTMHMPFDSRRRRIYETLVNPFIVSISNAQITNAHGLNYAGNVYNGLDMKDYPFTQNPGNYLLFVGTISKEKGIHIAIRVAEEMELPLIIAAKLNNKDRDYFNEFIKPKLSKKIRWIGEVDEKRRNKLMTNALCFLHPVIWREPFGLTVIEAMACGCPVVAFKRGATREIIKDGKTGFLVDDVEGMIEAVSNIAKISRQECRKYSLEKFNDKRMTDEYEEIYRKILLSKRVKLNIEKAFNSAF